MASRRPVEGCRHEISEQLLSKKVLAASALDFVLKQASKSIPEVLAGEDDEVTSQRQMSRCAAGAGEG